MKQLIVNADDFGLTRGLNQAILELHQQGLLSSATLMANAPATSQAISLALAAPTLGVGCHVQLVDGIPLADPATLPSLTSSQAFLPNVGAFLKRLYTSSYIEAEIEAESLAQITLLQSRGLTLTHIDTHKHTHIFPRVLRPLLRAARRAGIPAIRNPFEPAWSIRATPCAPHLRRLQVHLLRTLESSFLAAVSNAGLRTTHGSIGVLATGTLDHPTLDALLSNLPDGTFELVTHPGYNDADLARANTRLLASRETEREALKALKSHPAIELITFSQLASPPQPVRQ